MRIQLLFLNMIMISCLMVDLYLKWAQVDVNALLRPIAEQYRLFDTTESTAATTTTSPSSPEATTSSATTANKTIEAPLNSENITLGQANSSSASGTLLGKPNEKHLLMYKSNTFLPALSKQVKL